MSHETPQQINLVELKKKVLEGIVPLKLDDKIEVTSDGKIMLDGKQIGEVKEDIAPTN